MMLHIRQRNITAPAMEKFFAGILKGIIAEE
jgi:hypothetical protein